MTVNWFISNYLYIQIKNFNSGLANMPWWPVFADKIDDQKNNPALCRVSMVLASLSDGFHWRGECLGDPASLPGYHQRCQRLQLLQVRPG